MMTDKEKESLKRMVDRNLFRKAVDEVCSNTPMAMNETVEAKALQMKFIEGMIWGFNSLFELGGVKAQARVLPRRLRKETK